jgi:hypothetical protein
LAQTGPPDWGFERRANNPSSLKTKSLLRNFNQSLGLWIKMDHEIEIGLRKQRHSQDFFSGEGWSIFSRLVATFMDH